MPGVGTARALGTRVNIDVRTGMSLAQQHITNSRVTRKLMNNIIYIVGLIVVVGAVLSFLGLH